MVACGFSLDHASFRRHAIFWQRLQRCAHVDEEFLHMVDRARDEERAVRLVDVPVVVERLGAETRECEVLDEVSNARHMQRLIGGSDPEFERSPDPSRDVGLENWNAA